MRYDCLKVGENIVHENCLHVDARVEFMGGWMV